MAMVSDRTSNSAAESPVTASIEIAAPATRLWQCWTVPEYLAGWFVDSAEWEGGATGQPSVGGAIICRFEHFGFSVRQRVLTMETPHRLVLRAEDSAGGERRLEVSINAGVQGTTVGVREFNTDALDSTQRRDLHSGWQIALAILKYYAEHCFGESRRQVVALKPYAGSFRAEAFVDATWLSTWLTRSGAPAVVGGSFEMVLHNNTSVRGVTLAITEREVAFAWTERRAAIELKAFGSRYRTTVGIRASFWSADSAAMQWHEAWIRPAVNRLAG